jgi:hypothetical protein
MNHAQSEVLLERLEVAVVVKQLVALLNAESGDDAVGGLAYGHSLAPQRAKVLGRTHGKGCSHRFKNRECAKPFLGLKKSSVKADSLKNLAKNQAGEPDMFAIQRQPEPDCLRGDLSVQCIDPDAAVDDHHTVTLSPGSLPAA